MFNIINNWTTGCRTRHIATKCTFLKELKEAYPIEVAEYAVTAGIDGEPAFIWWVPRVLKKRDRIISKVKSALHHKKNHKFGIELPKSVADAV